MSKDHENVWAVGGRALWFGLGAVFQLLVALVLVLLIVQDDELAAVIVSAISAFSSLGLLAVAIWAGVVGVKTMHASKAASDAARDASIEAGKSNVLQAASNRASRRANRQAEIDSKNASRPYVGISLEPGINGDGAFDIMVKNYGRSIAKNLTIEIDEVPHPVDSVVQSLLEMFETPRSLMPGQSIRAIWHLSPGPNKKFGPEGDPDAAAGNHRTDAAGMRSSALLTASYTDANGSHYTEDFEVMFDRAGLWPIPNAGPDVDDRTLRPIDFYQLGQTIAMHIGSTRYR